MYIAELKEFEKELSGKSAATAEKYLRDAENFVRFCGGEFTKEKTAQYRKELCEKYKPRSVNSIIAAVNCFLDFSGLHDVKMKSVKVQKEVFCPETKELTRAEYERLCCAARVNPDKVFPHNLRHLFARIFYAIDKDIAKLADILGHSSIETTRIYIISTGIEHRRRMEKMRLVM